MINKKIPYSTIFDILNFDYHRSDILYIFIVTHRLTTPAYPTLLLKKYKCMFYVYIRNFIQWKYLRRHISRYKIDKNRMIIVVSSFIVYFETSLFSSRNGIFWKFLKSRTRTFKFIPLSERRGFLCIFYYCNSKLLIFVIIRLVALACWIFFGLSTFSNIEKYVFNRFSLKCGRKIQ